MNNMKSILTLLVLTSLWKSSSLLSNTNKSISFSTASGIRQPLYVLVTGPYPDPHDTGFDDGISLISAVRLAFRQINNRTDIIPGYRLESIEDDSGCGVKVKAVESFIRNVYYSSDQVVGHIGPACSGSTLLLKPILSQPEVSLISISPTSTSPELIGSSMNSNTFTMLSPIVMIESLASLMTENNWNQVATLYDAERIFFVQSQERFQQKVSTIDDLSIVYTSHIVDNQEVPFFPLDKLADRRARIVLLFTASITARRILCLAMHFDMLYPKYQWIIPEKNLSDLEATVTFRREGNLYNCSKDVMATALNGVILSHFQLSVDDGSILSTTNQTYAEYREHFHEEFSNHWNELRVQKLLESYPKDQTRFLPNNWENTYYDAAWAFGLALDRALRSGANLAQYTFGQPNVTSIIGDSLRGVTFKGATGSIDMGGSDRAHTTIDISQVWTSTASVVSVVQIANYSKGDLHFIKQDNNFIMDRFPEVPLRIHYGLSVVIITMTTIVIALTFLLHIGFIVWQNEKSIKATSPKISHLIFSGCYLFSLATILYAVQESFQVDSTANMLAYSVMCNIITWCLLLGYSLIFGTVLVKIWRVYKLFKHFRNKKPGKYLADNALIIAVMSLVVVDVIICAIWNIIDPWKMSTTDTAFSGNLTVYVTVSCRCSELTMYYMIGGIAVYKGAIGFLLIVFSILNRKIQRKHFSHTKKVNILVYSITLLSGVGFPLLFLLNNISIYVPFLILCTILIATVLMCCVILFLPPILPVLKLKLRRNCYKVHVTECNVHVRLPSIKVPV